MTIFIACVVIANLKVLILAYQMSLGLGLALFFGVVSFYVCSAIARKIFPFGEMRNVLNMQVQSYSYWLAILASSGIVFCFESIIKRYGRLKELEKQVRVEFVEKEIEMSLLEREKWG
jgi:hypothetical protein